MKLQLRLTAFTLFLNRNFRWVVLGAVLTVFAVGLITLIIPKWSQVSKQGLLALDRERERTKQQEAYLVQLRQSLDAYHQFTQSQVDALERVLPKGFDVAPIFVEMSTLFENAGYALSSIGITEGAQNQVTVNAQSAASAESAEVKKLVEEAQKNAEAVFLDKNLRSVLVNMELNGSQKYEDIKRLLATIEQHPRIMDIRSIGFNISDETTADSQDGVSSSGAITLSANLYYFAE